MTNYNRWFETRVQSAMADSRPPLTEIEWQAIRAAKQAERERLLSENFNANISDKRFTATPVHTAI